MRPLFQRQILNPMDFKKTRDVHDWTIYKKIFVTDIVFVLSSSWQLQKFPTASSLELGPGLSFRPNNMGWVVRPLPKICILDELY